MKKIAIIYYSQSGRADQVIQQLKETKTGQDINLSFFPIEAKKTFKFLWSFSKFMGAFPDSVLQKPVPLKVTKHKGETFDLILLLYPVWYLSPAIPVSSFLQFSVTKKMISKTFKKYL